MYRQLYQRVDTLGSLFCLYEQHKTTDETEARQNVLNRFGNPASIAYQLWFELSKEMFEEARRKLKEFEKKTS